MARGCWRLLAAFLLILVTALLRGQDTATDRARVQAPNPELLRYAPIGEQEWIPRFPEREPAVGYPVGRYPIVSGPIVSGPIVSGPIGFPESFRPLELFSQAVSLRLRVHRRPKGLSPLPSRSKLNMPCVAPQSVKS